MRALTVDECGEEVVLPPVLGLAMAERLANNSHKSRWSDLTPRQCLDRAKIELAELRRALEANESPERVAQEAGDVANFLAMLIVNYRVRAAEEGTCDE